MSNRSKPNRAGPRPAASSPQRQNSIVPFIAVVVIVVAGLGVWRWRAQRALAPPPASPAVSPQAANTTPPVGVVAPSPDFQKLKGKWLRPDGGYVIDIKSVADTGALDAAYLNPKPIHVAKAEASREGAAMKVFVELRDVDYPGSTYTLVYKPESDQLHGIYFQAVQQQNFEVVFVRMP